MTTLYTIPETARRLGCCRGHVYNLIARGELRVVDIASPGARKPKTRVPESALAAYVERHARTAAQSA